MKRIVLFSTLTDTNKETILKHILPTEILSKTIAYMPSGGIDGAQEYIKQWEAIARKYDAGFTVINNQSPNIEEADKLLASNILVISGGNTFTLLNNLKTSGLDNTIKQFFKKPEFVLAGFSAGALVLTPTIKICNLPNFDDNSIGLEDLDSLNIVDFEVFPHFNKDIHEKLLVEYRVSTKNRVREITDEDFISINL